MPLQGAIVVCYDDQLWGSGRGAIAGCHCSVLWWGEGRVTTNFGGVDVAPWRATVRCHCSVLWLGGRVATRSGCAIAGCHCSVPRCGKGEGRPSLGEWCHCCHCCVLWLGGEEDDQLWGSGAIAVCHCSWGEGRVTTNFGGVDVVPLLGAHTQQWHPDKLP